MAHNYTNEELNKFSKQAVITMFLSLQDQMAALNQNMEILIEQLKIANQKRFGRSSERLPKEQTDGQMTLSDFAGVDYLFNEAESLMEDRAEPDWPELEKTALPKNRKKPGKREADLSKAASGTVIIRHELSEEELNAVFRDGKWKCLPDEVYKRLACVPATYTIEEHHVCVYAGYDNQTIVKGRRPPDLLRNSIATPSLVAAVMNGKYVNALPLNRIEKEFLRNGINISRQVMANWMIRCAERFLSLLITRLPLEFLNSPVHQADEPPVVVSKDGRGAGSKSYMWVYRTGSLIHAPPIILYDFQRTRSTDHPREFLKNYSGTLITDGYEVYHALERERGVMVVGGCWSHSRRRFADIVKASGKGGGKGTLAYDALKQIGVMYEMEKTLAGLSDGDRKNRRQLSIKPLVDAFFIWIREKKDGVPAKSATGKGFAYCLNQEKYLRVFLSDGRVPIDNNASERAIRGFCIGRNNWKLIDTLHGADASAIIYSITETARANNLNPYRYLAHLFTEIPKHLDDSDQTFIESLLPWSDSLPDEIRIPAK
jgi:transposase